MCPPSKHLHGRRDQVHPPFLWLLWPPFQDALRRTYPERTSSPTFFVSPSWRGPQASGFSQFWFFWFVANPPLGASLLASAQLFEKIQSSFPFPWRLYMARFQVFTPSQSSAPPIPGKKLFGLSDKETPVLPFRFKLTGQDLTDLLAPDLNIHRDSLHLISKSKEIMRPRTLSKNCVSLLETESRGWHEDAKECSSTPLPISFHPPRFVPIPLSSSRGLFDL